jgi:hypothetical protein
MLLKFGHLRLNSVNPDSSDRIPAIWPERLDPCRLAGIWQILASMPESGQYAEV